MAIAFWDHIWGREGASGVAMHMGHFRQVYDARIKQKFSTSDGFFGEKQWQDFITSATACRMLSTPMDKRAPCCSCAYLGGDGTAIGVPTSAVANADPAWAPMEIIEPLKNWGRLQRCGIASLPYHDSVERKDLQDSRDILLQLTDSGINEEEKAILRNQLHEYKEHVGLDIYNEAMVWCVMTRDNKEYSPLRLILRALGKQDSISGIISYPSVNLTMSILQLALDNEPSQLDRPIWKSNLQKLCFSGMGPEIVQCLNTQCDSGEFRITFLKLVFHIGK